MKNLSSFFSNRSNRIMILAIAVIAMATTIEASLIKTTVLQKTEVAFEGQNENSSDDAKGAETQQDPLGDMTCTISISCDSVLDNRSRLKAGKEAFIPSDGCILAIRSVGFSQGETVLDILNRVCDSEEIQLEYSYSPLYDSYYVEGINHLYEFDCGSSSGWTYQVNDIYPNYGCSAYTVSDGDVILWSYTCTG